MGFPEIARFRSGGGYSQHFPRPHYRGAAVLTFLQNFGNQYAGLYGCVRCHNSA